MISMSLFFCCTILMFIHVLFFLIYEIMKCLKLEKVDSRKLIVPQNGESELTARSPLQVWSLYLYHVLGTATNSTWRRNLSIKANGRITEKVFCKQGEMTNQ